MGLEVPLDAGLEGDRGGWAADAGAVHPDLDVVVGGEADELDVAAVGLNGRADEFDDSLDAVGERAAALGCPSWVGEGGSRGASMDEQS